MDKRIAVNECLSDLNLALQSLEALRQQGVHSQEVENCLKSLSAFKVSLVARIKRETPLKWLGLRTGIYNPLMRAGYHTIESVARLTPKQILAIPLIGTDYRDKILNALDSWHQKPRTSSPEDSYFEL
jgi:DNA-directed RNA polymerase alpha subunit